MSNRFYTSIHYPLNYTYRNIAENNFLGNITSVDFTASESVRQEINDDVEKDTGNKIEDFIKPGK